MKNEAAQKNIIRILLIEDTALDAKLFRHQVDHATNISFEITDVPRMAEAIKLLDSKKFDIIFLDLNLPDVHGDTAVSELRAACAYISLDIPIVVYSGSDDLVKRENAFLNGAQEYLVKNKQNGGSIREAIQQALMAAL